MAHTETVPIYPSGTTVSMRAKKAKALGVRDTMLDFIP